MKDTSQQTERQLLLFPELESTSSQEAPPAKDSVSPESGSGRETHAPPSRSSMPDWCAAFVPASCSGRTCPAYSRPTAAEISEPSCVRWRNSGTVSHGACWTFSTPEWTASPERLPSGGAVCGLSDVLEETDESLLKYFLSARACSGILRRAERRGKDLPPLLDTALREMIAWWKSQDSPSGGGQIAPSLIASDYKGPGNTQDGKMIVQSTATTSPAPSAPPTEKGRTDRTSASSSASASFDGHDVSATLHKPNGSPGYSDQEVFSQGGGVPRQNGDEVVSIAKEAYNAGARQNGALGFGTDGVAACVRADDHPAAVATK